MKILVEAYNTPSVWRVSGQVKLRIYANQPFFTSGGQFVPQGNASGPAYLEINCTVLSNVLTIEGFEIDSTVDSPDNPWATYSAELVAGGRRYPFLTNFAINTAEPGDPSTTWGEIILLRNSFEPQTITDSLTRQLIAQIQLAVGGLNKASETNTGVTALTTDPVDPAFPIAVSANDPDYLELLEGGGGGGDSSFLSAVNLMDEQFHASGSPVTTTLAAEVLAGESAIPVVSANTFAVGQGVFIAGAGAAGANYIGTITAIDGTVFTVAPVTSTTVAIGAKVQHDDTAATNAAVTAAIAAGESSTVIAPKGRYRINGPLQGAVGHQSRIPLQYQGAATAKHILIQGESSIGQLIGTVPGSGQQPSTDGTIFESESNGGAIFGGEWTGGTAANFSMMAVEFDRVVVRNKDNPTQHGIDGALMFALIVRNSVIDTGKYTTDCAQPTTAGVAGLIMPTVNNNFPNIVENVGISGYDRGLVPGEHTVMVGHLVVAACNSALYFAENQFHDCYFDRVLAFNCTNILNAAGRAMIQMTLDVEHANSAGLGTPAWQDTVWDINDPGNLLRGEVKWHVVKASVGISDTFTQNGAFHLRTPQIRNSAGSDALTGGGALLVPYVQLHNSANQPIPNNTPTNITFDTEEEDFWGMHSTVSNTHRITPVKIGIIDIAFVGEFEGAVGAPGTTGVRQFRLMKHRGAFNDEIMLWLEQRNPAGEEPVRFGFHSIQRITHQADFFYIVAVHNAGVGVTLNVTTQNFFSPRLNAKIT